MDKTTQREVARRLRSVEGHVRGVAQMVEEGRPCMDLFRQTQALQGSVRQIGLLLLSNHLDGCLRDAWEKPEGGEYEQVRDELMFLFSQKV